MDRPGDLLFDIDSGKAHRDVAATAVLRCCATSCNRGFLPTALRRRLLWCLGAPPDQRCLWARAARTLRVCGNQGYTVVVLPWYEVWTSRSRSDIGLSMSGLSRSTAVTMSRWLHSCVPDLLRQGGSTVLTVWESRREEETARCRHHDHASLPIEAWCCSSCPVRVALPASDCHSEVGSPSCMRLMKEIGSAALRPESLRSHLP